MGARCWRLVRYFLNGFLSMTLLVGCGAQVRYESLTRDGIYHHVQRGQTLWSIAQAYDIELKTLAQANKLSNTHTLYVGQKLYIPGATQNRSVASRCPCRPTQISDDSAKQTSALRIDSPPKTSAFSSLQEPPSLEHVRLIWPLPGVITRDFTQRDKHRHDGIDIAAPKETSIRAAADGKVIYSDWGPGGYGRLVILQHSEDIVTVYAHNERNLVSVGEFVRQGNHIATVGKSGRATSYHLHFEVRRKTVPIPPLPFLPEDRQIARVTFQ
jgi:murein DD-endopeptidase MepM/ murein hydrolase activator NlpD